MNSTALVVTTTDKSDRVLDSQSIADQELNKYLESQANSIAPEISPIIPKIIQVEKVGITRNSSSTPYLVYTIEARRHCIFFKRKLLWHLLQAFLNSQRNIEDKIRAVISTERFDLKVMLGETWQTLFKPHVALFVEQWNNYHHLRAIPKSESLKDDLMEVREGESWANDLTAKEMHRHQFGQKNQSEIVAPPGKSTIDRLVSKILPFSEETKNAHHTQDEGSTSNSNHTNHSERLTTSAQDQILPQSEFGERQSQQLHTATPSEKLAAAMRNAIASKDWEIFTTALYGNEKYKAEAWKQLSAQEQQQLTQLTPPQVKMLAQARKAGKIATFVEHSVGGVFYIWLDGEAEAKMMTSTALPGFLQNLGN